jgi:capping protein alpha|mmetsp:Transcript_11255/g.33230  ORF Transcript_11255/g.33230 Transcript_11255/m.33230 type:complete len:188 (-) Transcript_11255:580-1143(-)
MLVEPSKTTGRADAEMLEIVQHLVLSSPPGEFDEVWYDAQILVPKLISPQILAGIARAYNHENLSVAKTADGLRVLLHKAAEISPTRYVDYTTRTTFRVDHVLRSAVTVKETLIPTMHDVMRHAIDDAARSYVMTTFDVDARPSAAVHVNIGRAELVIAMSGERANLSNFWSGNWRSEWTEQWQRNS